MNATTPALPKKVHVIGICGVATSAVAIAFKERGVHVSGSDKGFYPPVSTELEKHGIDFYAGWHPEKMFGGAGPKDAIVIIGTAAGTHNPEMQYAQEKGVPTYSYPEIIGAFFAREKSIVCAGTWGKTSSSALLSYILDRAGFEPTYMFGGISLSHTSSARLTDSAYSVFEGDEYKSSPTDLRAKFFHYKANHLLLSAVSWDHADLYPTEADYFEAFDKLVASISANGLIVACADQPGVMATVGSYKGKTVLYGRERPMSSDKSSYYAYKDVLQTKTGLNLTITHDGQSYNITSPQLGLYQSENITGCFAMAHQLGVEPAKIIEAIASFKGLKRRMEKRFDGDITVIDDIAHSPEKASPALNTLRAVYSGQIIAVFEPNIGGRRPQIAEKYSDAFADADLVVIPRLTKLKIADDGSQLPLEGDQLADLIKKTHDNVIYEEDDEKLTSLLASQAKKGDVIAFLGSHGFRGMIEETIRKIK